MQAPLQLITSLRQFQSESIQERLTNAAAVGVTIGNFDGMHLGHQGLFRELDSQLQSRAGNEAKVKALMTFTPHPRRVLSKRPREELVADPSFWTISSQRRKIQLAAEMGFDFFVLLRFTPSFASLSPEEFVRRYIVQALQADVVVVGYDWSFGKGRSGTVETLSALSAQYDFHAEIVEPVLVAGDRVSSSTVKAALASGDLQSIQRQLGRHFEVEGIVRHGEKRGRTLGFPTANLRPREQLLPPDGVYATYVRIEGDETRYAAASSLGVRPVFEKQGERLLEAYLLDQQGIDLYGKRIRVEFVEKLRDEQNFDSLDDLLVAMKQDVANVRRILGT